MKKAKIISQFVLVLCLSLLIFSCKKELKSNSQKTPQELSDEARLKQVEMEDSIQALRSMKRELNRLRKLTSSKPCNCIATRFNATSKSAWVKFALPAGKKNQKILIKKGSYKTPPTVMSFLNCSRVYWTDLTFKCDPKSCKWKKVSGFWRSSDQCLGTPKSSGKMKYVKTGYRK